MSKRPITAEDLLKFKFVGDPQVSPNAEQAAYVLTQIDGEKDGYYSSIYVTDLKGEGQPFTYHYDKDKLIKDMAPRWSPDGKTIAFMSNRTGKMQVWALPVGGGEAQPLTDVEQGVSEFAWSPDGTKLALTILGDVKTNDEESKDSADNDATEEKAETKKKEEKKSDVKVITRLRYKMDGVGIFSDDRKHVYLYDIETKQYTKVTDGDFDFGQPVFSPDGKSLVYVATKEETELRFNPSIWLYDIEEQKESQLFEGRGGAGSPSFSPDGKWVAFVGHDRGEFFSGNSYVWVVSTETGEAKSVSARFDYTVGDLVGVDAKYDTGSSHKLVWSEDSSSIYFIATVGGDTQLFKTTLDGTVSEALTASNATVTSFDLVDDNRAILTHGNPHSTGDIVLQDLTNVNNKTQLTHWNKDLFDEVHLSTPEEIHYKSTDGWDIEGWILKPYGFEKGKKYPMILQIHGGPHTAYGNGLHHEMQLMAAKGYVVLYTNPRGSHGYGETFVQAVVGDYSGMDYTDIMAGVDYSVETFDFIDQDQLFVTGGSYGGYMTNVIVTKTDRFKAAVTQRSICNWHSFFGTSDIGFFFTKWQHGEADLWDDEDRLLEISPIRHARKVKTPTLILHSEQDLRCPMEQAEQWYIALKRLGVETKLVRFPDENHDLSRSGKPQHRLERLEHLIGWFDDRRE